MKKLEEDTHYELPLKKSLIQMKCIKIVNEQRKSPTKIKLKKYNSTGSD